MGSSNRWYVDVNVTDQNTVEKIIEKGRQIDKEKFHSRSLWDLFVFRKWCESTKWDPIDLLQAISLEFPLVMFSAQYYGDYGSGKIFISNGESIEEKDIWINPRFPTATTFKKAIKAKKMRDKVLQEQREKKAAQEREVKRLKEIEETEKRLSELKAGK